MQSNSEGLSTSSLENVRKSIIAFQYLTTNTMKPAASKSAVPASRIIEPDKLPRGIDILERVKASKRAVSSGMERRMEELEQLADSVNDDVKIRALIELKGLRLASKQREIRDDFLNGYKRAFKFESEFERGWYRRN
ncbi:hypothetical protein ROZALSC1DRAFT_28797, partial [Rozella allomycis CSF55]